MAALFQVSKKLIVGLQFTPKQKKYWNKSVVTK